MLETEAQCTHINGSYIAVMAGKMTGVNGTFLRYVTLELGGSMSEDLYLH